MQLTAICLHRHSRTANCWNDL